MSRLLFNLITSTLHLITSTNPHKNSSSNEITYDYTLHATIDQDMVIRSNRLIWCLVFAISIYTILKDVSRYIRRHYLTLGQLIFVIWKITSAPLLVVTFYKIILSWKNLHLSKCSTWILLHVPYWIIANWIVRKHIIYELSTANN